MKGLILQRLTLGRSTVRWLDTPHLPHAWECGMLHEERTRTLLCRDLFTQGGADHPPLTEGDILGPSEADIDSQCGRSRFLITPDDLRCGTFEVGGRCVDPQPEEGALVTTGRYRTIWVSDTHLGTRDCQAGALLEFLEGHECEYLYLVGDIIDFWRLKRAPQWIQLHTDVVRTVVSKARDGTLVTFVPGNHDEYLRRFCDLQLGNIMVTREAVHRTADGRLFLIVHGDEFDSVLRSHRWLALTGDVGYEMLLVANRWFNHGRRLLGLPYASLSAYVKHKVKRALSYITAFETTLAREAARRDMHGVVCGHIHRAEIREIDGVVYCNTGDWVESCTALAERMVADSSSSR